MHTEHLVTGFLQEWFWPAEKQNRDTFCTGFDGFFFFFVQFAWLHYLRFMDYIFPLICATFRPFQLNRMDEEKHIHVAAVPTGSQ